MARRKWSQLRDKADWKFLGAGVAIIAIVLMVIVLYRLQIGTIFPASIDPL